MRQRGFAPLLILILVLIIAAVATGAYYLGARNVSAPGISNTPSASTGPIQTVAPVSGKAEDNTLYFGTYNGQEVIFQLTNVDTQVGMTVKQDKMGEGEIAFSQIQTPKKVFSWTAEIGVVGFAVAKSKPLLYVATILADYSKESSQWENALISFDLVTGQTQTVWSHKMFTESYGQAKGGAYINKVSDDGEYVALDLINCYACEGTYVGTLVVNIETKAEKFVEGVGNFNFANGNFTYQKLAPFKEPCENDIGIGCDEDGNRTVYKPSGQTYTEKLP